MDKEIEKEYYKKHEFESSASMASRIRGLHPSLGYIVRVENLEVPKEIFEEEYEILWNTYQKVLDKIKSKHSYRKAIIGSIDAK